MEKVLFLFCLIFISYFVDETCIKEQLIIFYRTSLQGKTCEKSSGDNFRAKRINFIACCFSDRIAKRCQGPHQWFELASDLAMESGTQSPVTVGLPRKLVSFLSLSSKKLNKRANNAEINKKIFLAKSKIQIVW